MGESTKKPGRSRLHRLVMGLGIAVLAIGAWFLIVFAYLGVVALTGFMSDPLPPEDVGVSLAGSDRIVVAFNPGRPAAVSGVRLLRVHGIAYGDEDDEVLWKIHAVSPRPVRTLVIGESLEGFVEDSPLQRPQVSTKCRNSGDEARKDPKAGACSNRG